MRVALFTDADVFAGTERHILALAVGLVGEGVSAAIACPDGSPLSKRAVTEGIPFIPIPKGALIDKTAIRILMKLLRSGEIDIIHAHNGRTLLSSVLAIRLARVGRCVATQHFITPTRTTRKGFRSWASAVAHQWVVRHVDHFIAISSAVRKSMEDRGEAVNGSATVVPNGIAIEADTLDQQGIAAVRRELGVREGEFLVVCAARLEKEKSLDTLITAMSIVAKSHADVICAIAGEGAEQQSLREVIARLGLCQQVRLLGYRDDALSIIAAADIFVLPSLAEPFGLVLLEAMALAKPVVSTRAGGPLEIVEEGRTGLLVAPGDPMALAQAILTLNHQPQLAKEMGMRGSDRYHERFTAQRMVLDTLSVYHKVISDN